ncbi:MAG: GDP-mannose 4,6-dehydratase [Alphaproteobacteria bacterium]|nr:GDP-mannose 4,6-dehydratase [Alphaproteobacteria bacterium]
MGKQALIFGVSGQDGAYLAQLLLDKGYVVHGTSRDSEQNAFTNLRRLGIHERVKTHSAITTDFRSILAVIRAVQPDEIYDLSGQTSVSLSYSQPVEALESIALGATNILEVLRILGLDARFFSAGSGECFGDTGHKLADEQSPFRPLSPYAVAKSAAFWTCASYRRSYKLFCCSGILFNHESPLRPARFVTQKIALAAARIRAGSGEKLRLGNTNVLRDWGWAPDYVEAMWRILQNERPDDFVIATGQAISLQDYVAMCFRHVGLDWRDHVVIDPLLLRPSDQVFSAGDSSKARRELGWQPTLLAEDVSRRMTDAAVAQLAGRAPPGG